jgi:hypothetical protein
MNLKLIEVQAYSKKDAIEVAKSEGFELDVKYDATLAYNNAIIEHGFNVRDFAESQIEGKARGAANVGFNVTVDAGKPETKTRLYKAEVIPTEGPRQYYVAYQLTSGDRILGDAPTKEEAIALAKDMIKDVKGDIDIDIIKKPTTNGLAAHVKYDPSPDTKLGTYILFGYSL